MTYYAKNLLTQFSAIIVILLAIAGCSNDAPSHHTQAGDTAQPVRAGETATLFNGIPVDSYNIVTGRIMNNQVISSILASYGVPWDTIETILRNNRNTFDPRKVHTGSSYSVFLRKDSIGNPDYFIYEHDERISYLFSFCDSLTIRKINAEVRQVLRYSSGTINTSLWESAVEKNLNPNLASELSDIYAWTIDFFGLQKGDRYKVIYEEEFIGDRSVGIGRVHAAAFEHAGSTIYAIPYVQDSIQSFFDSTGASLRKAFLKAPLRFSRISSHFSNARRHPILKTVRPHHGVDYAAPIGTPVMSIGDGRVTETSNGGGAGRMVKITHNSMYSTAYLHLSRFGEGIRPGVYVKQGDVIGYVGSSGLSTGPHLDFRFYKGGSAVNPLTVDSPPVNPVAETNKAQFTKIEKGYISLLETISY